MDGLIFGLVVGTLACVVALLLPVPNKSKQTVYLSRQADNDDYMLKDAIKYLKYVPYQDDDELL